MKRLYDNLEPSIPFINSDFSDILQEQHRIAYASYLESLNDVTYLKPSVIDQLYQDQINSDSTGQSILVWDLEFVNRGILLEGVDVSVIRTRATKYHYDWRVTINSEALVFFDGQFYSPNPDTLSGNQTLVFEDKPRLYIYPITVTQSFNPNDEEGPIERAYRIGTTYQMATDYYFDIQDNENYPGATQGVPCIIFEHGGTSRNLSRLIRLNTSVPYDLKISYDVTKYILASNNNWGLTYSGGYTYRDFELTGEYVGEVQDEFKTGFLFIGRNELKGFLIPNFEEGNTKSFIINEWAKRYGTRKWNSPIPFMGYINSKGQPIPTNDLFFLHQDPIEFSSIGNSQTNEGQGRFLVGMDTSLPTTPIHLTSSTNNFVRNYGTPSNTGGWINVKLETNQLPAHNHGGITKKPYAEIDVDSYVTSADETGVSNQVELIPMLLPPPDYPQRKLTNLDHSHAFLGYIAKPLYQDNSGQAPWPPHSIGYGNAPPDDNSPSLDQYIQGNNIFYTRSKPFFTQQIEIGNNNPIARVNEYDPIVDPSNHIHEIEAVGDSENHENRPPYVVVLYYYRRPKTSPRPGYHDI